MIFWNNVQSPPARRFVLSNDKLQSLFGETRFQAFGVQKYLSKHIIKKS